ncbi:DinB family protein, partial [Nitrosomonas nitrosa]|uniref:DinB family protein n=1 Tax=Nitrosomonas nitrosa TaxID=52442 RepID=UPI0023F89C7A
MASRTLSAAQILALLADAPPHIADFTASMAPAQLRTAPSPGEWSATEVLGHLRSCADVWGNCIDVILAEDEPTIKAINPKT